MRHFVALTIVTTLAACAATGVKVTEDQLSSLKTGSSTEAEVVGKLGSPTTRLRMADGSVMLQYVYAEATVRPATFIPVVGLFAGGSDSRSNVVTLRFGADGKLIDTTSASSTYGTGTGLSAGQVAPATEQPKQ
jgi:hypothetical protein